MENKIKLPKTFAEKDLIFLGGKKEWKKHIGKPKISYSDINLFLNETYSSNSLKDYVLQQFLKVPSAIHESYGEFGKAAEDYICKRENKWGFSEEEIKVLETITPLGQYQQGFVIDFADFVLMGLKDDVCENCEKKIIRDYKSASKGSYEKQYKDIESSLQLKIYALDWMINKNLLPDKLELVVIERLGNPYSKEEEERKLRVGNNVWTKEFTTNEKELVELKTKIVDTVTEISNYWNVFKKLNQ